MASFRDAVDEIYDDEPAAAAEAPVTPPAAPSEEAPPAVEKTEGDAEAPKLEEKVGETPEGAEAVPAGEKTDEAPATAETAPVAPPAVDEDPEVEITVNGEKVKVRLSKLSTVAQELADAQSALAEAKSATASEVAERGKLASDLAADPDMAEFVRAHPKALPYLMADPAATRALLGNPQAIEEFWADYEVLAANPRLAERLTAGDSEALEQQRVAQDVQYVANNLQRAVDTVAAQFPGVDKDEVARYVLDLGGMPRGENPAPKDVVAAFSRLRTLFFVQTGDGEQIDSKLIRDRFDTLSAGPAAEEARKAAEAKTHNDQVDAELRNERDRPPAAPAGGSPGVTEKEEKQPANFSAAMDDLLYGK